jgi:hypothetical protein
MLRMCVYMYSRFIENQSIQILKDGPLISEVVLSHHSENTNDSLISIYTSTLHIE